jgi:cyclohexyl-isocyanide hydratase
MTDTQLSMTDTHRRIVTILALLAPFTPAWPRTEAPGRAPETPQPGHDMSSMPASWTRHDQIAMLVYPKMSALDVIGPQSSRLQA